MSSYDADTPAPEELAERETRKRNGHNRRVEESDTAVDPTRSGLAEGTGSEDLAEFAEELEDTNVQIELPEMPRASDETEQCRMVIAQLERERERLRAELTEAERHHREAITARERELQRLRERLDEREDEAKALQDELAMVREESAREARITRAHVATLEDERERSFEEIVELDEELEAIRAELEAAREAGAAARSEAERLREDHAEAIAELRAAHEAALAELRAQHESEMRSLEHACESEIARTDENHERELRELAARHEQTLAVEGERLTRDLDLADRRAAVALATQYLLMSRMLR